MGNRCIISLCREVYHFLLIFRLLLLIRLFEYAAFAIEDTFYIMGGYDQNNDESSLIAVFNNNQWSVAGELNIPRYGLV